MTTFLRAVLRTLRWSGHQANVSSNNIVLITGCDSGLGFSLSLYCHSLNMTVVSACHNINSDGARMLQKLNNDTNKNNRMITIELDLLKKETITHAQQCVAKLMEMNEEYKLTAIVNNAGVMCFGEFEWQTSSQFEMQININVLGTMHLTKKFLPLVRKYRARIINITSHCGLQALPALSPYAASKAALRYWNDSLRIELQKYGVEVINFIPGSFVTESNISARQPEHAKDMLNEFSEEQRLFYKDYFKRFNDYLMLISGFKRPNQVHDDLLLQKFKDALTNTQPKAIYIHEPLRYKIYRILFSICPIPIVDWLAIKFCAMPSYQREINQNEGKDKI